MSEPPAESQSQESAGSPSPSLVVGIGASAGGIRALSAFFAAVPLDSPIAWVVILHLSPDHESRLAEVLRNTTKMPVTQVRGPMRLAPAQVYVIPPNETLHVDDDGLTIEPIGSFEERRAPVDIFFRTLAKTYGARAAVVVLSGTGSNGSSGLKHVKECGGLTIAQRPDEAEYSDMPRNSIATGLVDYVLPVAEMPARIVEYASRLKPTSTAIAAPYEDEAMREVLTLLRLRTGHDFSNYKRATVRRRVERRMAVHGLSTVLDYLRYARQHAEEPEALMKDLLISVTSFFRDREAFAVLEARIIPRLFEGKQIPGQVRAWSAGCATGEEAYSVAMLLAERAWSLPMAPAVQVFATDLDEQALAVAREGFYTEGDVADLAPHRLQRFFMREVAGYRVRSELRELVLFAQHDVLKDPPFSHLDLIVCRNLLIYLNRSIQERLIETFHFALRPGGFLFLGTSETADTEKGLFSEADKAAHVFERRIGTSRPAAMPPAVEYQGPPPMIAARAPEVRSGERIAPGELHLRLLEAYAPPSLVVSDENLLLHASDTAGRFLQMSGGEPSRDLFKLIHPDLRTDLRSALHSASQQRTPVAVRAAAVAGVTDGHALRLVVKPVLREGAPARGYFLVLFDVDDAPSPPAAVEINREPPTEALRLEEEVAHVRAQLRETIEQYETQVEESKAANEELHAMNEELRSAAEELETSKEELQSLNEELTTVNQELKIKIEELALTNNDFQNLINSTDIGTIFLDRSLRLKLFTPKAAEVFNLLSTDVGRRLSDITSHLSYEGLYGDITLVLDRLQAVEREVAANHSAWYLLRVVPYRTSDDRIDGVVITFQDITARRLSEAKLQAQQRQLRLLIDSAIDYAIFTISADGRVDSWNAGAERMFGYTVEEIVGQDAAVLFTPEDRAAGVPEQELKTAREGGRAVDEGWHLRKDGTRLYCSGVTTPLGDQNVGFAKIARDLTRQREAETSLARSHAELETRIAERTESLQAEVFRSAAARDDVTRLLRRVVSAQDDERARIARDLHDELGQQLTALRLALERYQERCPAETRDDVSAALGLTRALDAQVDFLAWELRPAALDDLGLAQALPRFVHEWSARYGVRGDCRVIGAITGLSHEAEASIYRIVQEALNNVIKHAHATRVDVVLEARDGGVSLVVEDDGVGFDPPEMTRDQGVGLAGMRERAALIGATFQVESSVGKGTSIFVRLSPSPAASPSPSPTPAA